MLSQNIKNKQNGELGYQIDANSLHFLLYQHKQNKIYIPIYHYMTTSQYIKGWIPRTNNYQWWHNMVHIAIHLLLLWRRDFPDAEIGWKIYYYHFLCQMTVRQSEVAEKNPNSN